MDKEKVLDYVMNSPGNSNRAVLNTMLNQISSGDGNGSGEWITIFDDDITLTYSAGSSMVPPSAHWGDQILTNIENKYIKITFDDIVIKIATILNDSQFSVSIDGIFLKIDNCNYLSVSYYEEFDIYISVGISGEPSPALETYCSTPKHLKIEYLNE